MRSSRIPFIRVNVHYWKPQQLFSKPINISLTSREINTNFAQTINILSRLNH